VSYSDRDEMRVLRVMFELYTLWRTEDREQSLEEHQSEVCKEAKQSLHFTQKVRDKR